jgi:hypothetical protein
MVRWSDRRSVGLLECWRVESAVGLAEIDQLCVAVYTHTSLNVLRTVFPDGLLPMIALTRFEILS